MEVTFEDLKGPFEAEPAFAADDEADDGAVREVWRVPKCPVGGCNFKRSKFWTYCGEAKMRKMVADHLINATKHEGDPQFWKCKGAAYAIAIDPLQTVVELTIESGEDRTEMRRDWRAQEAKAADREAKGKSKGKKGGKDVVGKGKGKRPPEFNPEALFTTVSSLAEQVQEIRGALQGAASSSAGDETVSIEEDNPLHRAEAMAGPVEPSYPPPMLSVAKRPPSFIKLNAESLEVMDSAFSQLSEDVTNSIKDLSKVSGNLAKSEAEIGKLVAFVRRLKMKLA